MKARTLYGLAAVAGAAAALLSEAMNPSTMIAHWEPGDYTNFVVVTATNASTPRAQWKTFLVTTETNFLFFTSDKERFFTLYGTNSDGQSAWIGEQP